MEEFRSKGTVSSEVIFQNKRRHLWKLSIGASFPFMKSQHYIRRRINDKVKVLADLLNSINNQLDVHRWNQWDYVLAGNYTVHREGFFKSYSIAPRNHTATLEAINAICTNYKIF